MISFCETRQIPLDDFSDLVPGYKNFDSPRFGNKKKQRGSGSVSVFVKNTIVESEYIKRVLEEFEECVVLWISNAIGLMNDVILVFPYVAPENSPIYNDENSNGIDILSHNLSQIEKEINNISFIIAGDLNARVKDFDDFILEDINYIFFTEAEYPGDWFYIP